MQVVMICGDDDDRLLTKTIARACSANGGVLMNCGGRLIQSSRNPGFVIFCADFVSCLDIPGAIIVLGRQADSKVKIPSSCGNVCVLDADDESSRIAAAETGAECVGCSLSGKETLSISGVTGKSGICVSLRRNIPMPDAADGEEVSSPEPCDFPVFAPGCNEHYPVLAAAAVLLLSGRDPSDGFSF